MKKWTGRFAHQLVDLTGFAEATDVATVLRAQGRMIAVAGKSRVIVTRRNRLSV